MRKALIGMILAATALAPAAAWAQDWHNRGDRDGGHQHNQNESDNNGNGNGNGNNGNGRHAESRHEERQVQQQPQPQVQQPQVSPAGAGGPEQQPWQSRRQSWRATATAAVAMTAIAAAAMTATAAIGAAMTTTAPAAIRRPGRAIPTIRGCATIRISSGATRMVAAAIGGAIERPQRRSRRAGWPRRPRRRLAGRPSRPQLAQTTGTTIGATTIGSTGTAGATATRNVFHLSPYYAPYRNWGYQRFSIGFFLEPLFFDQRYWIGDPYDYRLPPAPPGTEWVRYYNDVVLVDIYSGEVIDVIYDFFW